MQGASITRVYLPEIRFDADRSNKVALGLVKRAPFVGGEAHQMQQVEMVRILLQEILINALCVFEPPVSVEIKGDAESFLSHRCLRLLEGLGSRSSLVLRAICAFLQVAAGVASFCNCSTLMMS